MFHGREVNHDANGGLWPSDVSPNGGLGRFISQMCPVIILLFSLRTPGLDSDVKKCVVLETERSHRSSRHPVCVCVFVSV